MFCSHQHLDIELGGSECHGYRAKRGSSAHSSYERREIQYLPTFTSGNNPETSMFCPSLSFAHMHTYIEGDVKVRTIAHINIHQNTKKTKKLLQFPKVKECPHINTKTVNVLYVREDKPTKLYILQPLSENVGMFWCSEKLVVLLPELSGTGNGSMDVERPLWLFSLTGIFMRRWLQYFQCICSTGGCWWHWALDLGSLSTVAEI